MLAAKNSKKRRAACSPAVTISAGTVSLGCGLIVRVLASSMMGSRAVTQRGAHQINEALFFETYAVPTVALYLMI
jgi:hypothetical protein